MRLYHIVTNGRIEKLYKVNINSSSAGVEYLEEACGRSSL